MHHFQPGMAGAVLKDGVEVGFDGKSIARGPVGERDALADMESVDLAVRRNIPAFGQAGLVAVGRDVHQGLEDHFLCVHLTGIQVGIEIADIPVIDKIQRLGRIVRGPGIRAGKKECPGQGKREGQLAEFGMNVHAVRPLLWNKNSFSFPNRSMPQSPDAAKYFFPITRDREQESPAGAEHGTAGSSTRYGEGRR